MKIFQIRPKYDESGNSTFRHLEPLHGFDPVGRHRFDGSLKTGVLIAKDYEVSISDENLAYANFPDFCPGVLVADGLALSELYPILSSVAELLPLREAHGGAYTLVNLTPPFDCVDLERSEWKAFPSSGRAMSVSRYEFDVERLPKRSLFKTTMKQSTIFATQGHLEPAMEFKAQVERLGLLGLAFWEIWNNDGDPIPDPPPFWMG